MPFTARRGSGLALHDGRHREEYSRPPARKMGRMDLAGFAGLLPAGERGSVGPLPEVDPRGRPGGGARDGRFPGHVGQRVTSPHPLPPALPAVLVPTMNRSGASESLGATAARDARSGPDPGTMPEKVS